MNRERSALNIRDSHELAECTFKPKLVTTKGKQIPSRYKYSTDTVRYAKMEYINNEIIS